MMQEFLNSLSGNESKQVDPMESLIPKHLLGLRNYSPWFMGLLGVGTFSLVVTLSEIHPIFSQITSGLYLGLLVLMAIDVVDDHKKHGYLSRSRIQMYFAFYFVIAIVLTFVINLVSSI